MSEPTLGVSIGVLDALIVAVVVVWIAVGRSAGPQYRCSICGTTATGPTTARRHAMTRHGHGSHSWFAVMDDITDDH